MYNMLQSNFWTGFVFAVCICTLQFFSESVYGQGLAFPGAEGYGKETTGGRGGDVIYVTNLNDAGPGSLRNAVEKEMPRIVVFSVSGTIILESPLTITSGNITLAGQTAPGDGITLRDYPVKVEADNVIIRFMRFRLGDVNKLEADALGGMYIKDVIIDHCSMSWSIDEAVSFYRSENITLQWNIISESLNISYHSKGAHGYGGIWGGRKASFHHNLFAHHRSRNPRLADSGYEKHPTNRNLDFRYNVIYNWSGNSVYGGEKGEHNIVKNYFKPGPATPDHVADRIVNPSKPYGKFYVSGNIVEGYPEISADNWDGGVQSDEPREAFHPTPFYTEPLPEKSTEQAYDDVLEFSGASLFRDKVDNRIIMEVEKGVATYSGSKTQLPGIIDSQEEVGGWPDLSSEDPPADNDRDGMPDEWEVEQGLDPNDPSDAGKNSLHEHYTNIEVYINSLVEDLF